MPSTRTEWALTIFALAALLFAACCWVVATATAFAISPFLGVFMLALGIILGSAFVSAVRDA